MLLFLLSGVYGVIMLISGFRGTEMNGWLVYPVAAAFCGAIWYIYSYKRSIFYKTVIITFLVCILAGVAGYSATYPQLTALIADFRGIESEETVSVTYLVIVLLPFLVFIIFFLEAVIKNHFALYLLTTGLILSGPLLGVESETGAVIFLAAFQTAFLAYRATGAKFRRKSFHIDGRSRLAVKCGVITIIMSAIVLAIAAPIVYFNADSMYGFLYNIEGQVYRIVGNATNSPDDFVQGARVSQFNNYQTGNEQLVVNLTRQPNEPLYLRGFAGGDYLGNRWSPANDDDALDEIEAKTRNNWGMIGIDNMYARMYFVMNNSMQKEYRQTPRDIFIRYSNIDNKNYYIPYYSQYENARVYGGYRYQYFEQGEMNIDWNNVSHGFTQRRDRYYELQELYKAEAEKLYTSVPEERLPRLVKLCEENPLDNLEDITAFILYTLNSNAVYSQTPGWSALNGDVVEDFLFERKSGYCVHFASAATLMYRLYGIPARYATGYMIEPSEFERQEYRIYSASVTDEYAHAWTEIFIDNYGWTPIEVTPSSGGQEEDIYPGLSNFDISDLVAEHGWNVNISGLAGEEGQQALTDEAAPETAAPEETETDGEYARRDIDAPDNADTVIFIICVCVLAVLIPVLLVRLRKNRKRDTAPCRVVFSQLIEFLHFSGYMLEYDGSEREFAKELSNSIAAVSYEEAAKTVDIVNKAAYGPVPPTQAENEFVDTVYKKILDFIYKNSKWYRNLYIKIFFENNWLSFIRSIRR